MELNYFSEGPKSYGPKFPNKILTSLSREQGDLETALQNPDSQFSIHALIGEIAARPFTAAPFAAFSGVFKGRMATGIYFLAYNVSATVPREGGTIKHWFFGANRSLSVGGETLTPDPINRITRPEHYAQLIISVAVDILRHKSKVTLHSYEIGTELLTHAYLTKRLQTAEEENSDLSIILNL